MDEVPPPLIQIIRKITRNRISPEQISMDADLLSETKLTQEEFIQLMNACERILHFIFVPSFQPLLKDPPQCSIRDLIFYAQPLYILRPPAPEIIDLSVEFLILTPEKKGCLWIILFFLIVPFI
ncbi:MAG: hypothetical protein AABZ60_05670 [Planctomycetota bacterium]